MAEKTFTESMKKLQEAAAEIGKQATTLEDSLKLFEEGSALIRTCGNMLENAEQVIVKLVKGPDGEPEEAVFLDEDR